eukprot:scaffold9359_cov208-Skeletonema_marinoi.AAC.2
MSLIIKAAGTWGIHFESPFPPRPDPSHKNIGTTLLSSIENIIIISRPQQHKQPNYSVASNRATCHQTTIKKEQSPEATRTIIHSAVAEHLCH